MTNYKDIHLAPSIFYACQELRRLLGEVEDVSLDAVCQTELGVVDYDGQPNSSLIKEYAGKLMKIASLTQNLAELTTYTERRAIEAQGLLPWRFDK
jgi:hypothetical protein